MQYAPFATAPTIGLLVKTNPGGLSITVSALFCSKSPPNRRSTQDVRSRYGQRPKPWL